MQQHSIQIMNVIILTALLSIARPASRVTFIME